MAQRPETIALQNYVLKLTEKHPVLTVNLAFQEYVDDHRLNKAMNVHIRHRLADVFRNLVNAQELKITKRIRTVAYFERNHV